MQDSLAHGPLYFKMTSEITWLIVIKFLVEPLGHVEMKCLNGVGHMTNIAAIVSKKKKVSTESIVVTLKLGM